MSPHPRRSQRPSLSVLARRLAERGASTMLVCNHLWCWGCVRLRGALRLCRPWAVAGRQMAPVATPESRRLPPRCLRARCCPSGASNGASVRCDCAPLGARVDRATLPVGLKNLQVHEDKSAVSHKTRRDLESFQERALARQRGPSRHCARARSLLQKAHQRQGSNCTQFLDAPSPGDVWRRRSAC